MRSPERKGTVPSLAMAVPSKAIRMSPPLIISLTGLVGSTRRMYTPFCCACAVAMRRRWPKQAEETEYSGKLVKVYSILKGEGESVLLQKYVNME